MADSTLSHQNCLNKEISNFFQYNNGEDERIGIQCKSCSFEWLSKSCMGSQFLDEEKIVFEGTEFHLFTKRMYCDPDYCINKDHVELDDFTKLNDYLHKGAHICYKPNDLKGVIIIHHAIIERVKAEGGKTKVDLIHWSSVDGKPRREIVREKNVDLSTRTNRVIRCDYGNEYAGADSVQLTLARATALLGKVGYNLLTENCEHFATFCKIGTFHSWQVWYAVKTTVTAVKGAVSGVSKAIAGAVVKKGTSAIAGTAADIAGDVTEASVKGGEHFLNASTQTIGLGIVVVIQGVSFVINVGLLYRQKCKGELTEMQFKDRLWKEFITHLEGVFYTGGVPMAGALILGMFNPGTAVAVGGLLIWAVVGGALASYASGFDHTFMGRTMSHCTRPIMLYDSVIIESFRELISGDHLVIPQWMLHPRCHMIVVTVVTDTVVEVIRFTYDRGVVKDKIQFSSPSYKVIYKLGESFNSDKVIERATSKLGSKELVYRILQNNCKSFARWCKTGQLPYSVASVTGYSDAGKCSDVGGSITS